jgi:hypothetical protein
MTSDIYWYNSQTGETQIWLMNGSQIASRATVTDEHGTGRFTVIGAMQIKFARS